ncbi:hypothetical protein ES703_108631 [subsurface metagenome]
MAINVGFEAYIPLTGLDGGRLMMHCGNADMGGAVTTIELPTKLIEILAAKITPESFDDAAGPAAGDQVFFCDRVIAAGKVTVERKVDGGGDAFSFLLIGRVS